MPIMWQLGAKVVQQIQKTARCCAKPSIEQKEIGREYDRNLLILTGFQKLLGGLSKINCVVLKSSFQDKFKMH